MTTQSLSELNSTGNEFIVGKRLRKVLSRWLVRSLVFLGHDELWRWLLVAALAALVVAVVTALVAFLRLCGFGSSLAIPPQRD